LLSWQNTAHDHTVRFFMCFGRFPEMHTITGLGSPFHLKQPVSSSDSNMGLS
jgi:hypothetical protein